MQLYFYGILMETFRRDAEFICVCILFSELYIDVVIRLQRMFLALVDGHIAL